MRILLILLLLTGSLLAAQNTPASTGTTPLREIESFSDIKFYFDEVGITIDRLWRQLRSEIESVIKDEITTSGCDEPCNKLAIGTYDGNGLDSPGQTIKAFDRWMTRKLKDNTRVCKECLCKIDYDLIDFSEPWVSGYPCDYCHDDIYIYHLIVRKVTGEDSSPVYCIFADSASYAYTPYTWSGGNGDTYIPNVMLSISENTFNVSSEGMTYDLVNEDGETYFYKAMGTASFDDTLVDPNS